MKPMFWPILGAVRFYLALVVAGSHLGSFSPGTRVMGVFNDMAAFVAVLGFLVISGYSIAASEAKQPQGFYRRRLLRIMPLYVLSLVAAYGCTAAFGGLVRATNGEVFVTPAWRELIKNLFFLQGFTTLSIKTNPVVWTLSVEVFFYLLAPLLARLSQAALTAICLGSVALFFAGVPYHLPSLDRLQGGAAAAMLGWAWLAGFIAFRQQNHLKAALAVLAISLVALNRYAGSLTLYWTLPMIVVCLAIGCGGRVNGPRLVSAAGTRMGDASYPLYLFHLPLFIALSGVGWRLPALGYLGAAVAVGIALDRLFDQPLKKFIRGAKAPSGS